MGVATSAGAQDGARGPRLPSPGITLALYLLLVLVGTLYPFQFAVPATLLATRAEGPIWAPPDGLLFEGVGMFSFGRPSPDIARVIEDAGSFYVYLEAWPDSPRQYGPSRLFAFSRSKISHAFLVGQQGRALVFRVRHAAPSAPERGITQAIFPNALVMRAWNSLLFTADPTALRAFGNGRLLGEYRLENQPPAHWSDDNYLLAGNETTGNRGWRGRLRRIELGAGAPPERVLREAGVPPALVLTPGQAPPDAPIFDLDAAHSRLPEGWDGHRTDMWGRPPPQPWSLVPFKDTAYVEHPMRDIIMNAVLLAPVGWLWIRRGGRLVTAAALAAVLTLSIESAQVFLPMRSCDATDLVLNLTGAIVGATLAKTVASVRGRRRPASPA